MKVKGCQLSNSIVTQLSLILFSMLETYKTERISMELSVPILQCVRDLLVKFNWQENISAAIHYGRDSSLNARPTMYALNWMMLCYSWTSIAIPKTCQKQLCEDGCKVVREVEGICDSNQCGTSMALLLCWHWHVLHALPGSSLTKLNDHKSKSQTCRSSIWRRRAK